MNEKYVAKAEKGIGWRIFNRKTKRYWGQFFKEYPQEVLQELNNLARPEMLTKLCKSSQSKDSILKKKGK